VAIPARPLRWLGEYSAAFDVRSPVTKKEIDLMNYQVFYINIEI
jgi:hypothetical protein